MSSLAALAGSHLHTEIFTKLARRLSARNRHRLVKRVVHERIGRDPPATESNYVALSPSYRVRDDFVDCLLRPQERPSNGKQGPVSAASRLPAKGGCHFGDPCLGCSFEVDHIDSVIVHLEHYAVRYVAVSRGPYSEIDSPGSFSRSRHDQYLLSRMILSLRSQLMTVTTPLGAQVMMASNTGDQLPVAENCDLAVLDVELRDGDTNIICQRLNERAIPFIFCSRHDDAAKRPQAVIVEKPTREHVLITTLVALMRRWPFPQAAIRGRRYGAVPCHGDTGPRALVRCSIRPSGSKPHDQHCPLPPTANCGAPSFYSATELFIDPS